MGRRHLLITFNRAPHGSVFCTEGLRTAVGVTSGIDGHTVDILYLGDGVYFALKDMERSDSAGYLAALSAMGVNLKAEREALQARSIDESDLAGDFEGISRDQALELVGRADLTMAF